GVLAAAVGAAAVPQPDGYHRRVVGVGGRRVGERAGRRVDGRLDREQAGVVRADQERQVLACLVGGAPTDAGRPRGPRLRSGVLIDGLLGALREGRRVVRRVDGDGESLSGGGVLAAAVGAAVVPQPDGYHCRAVGVGGRRVGERAGRRVDGRS